MIIIHCTFSNAIVIEGYSLSCECLERLDLGLNNGWVSFTARFIKLYIFVSISQEDESLEHSYGTHTFVSLPTKQLQRANSKLTISKLAQAHERALGRARSQRFRHNEKLKKINERRRKDRLPALTLKLMRGDAPGSSVPLATNSATTEEAIVMRPTRRSSCWDVSRKT